MRLVCCAVHWEALSVRAGSHGTCHGDKATASLTLRVVHVGCVWGITRYDLAIRKCKEFVKQSPNYAAPYAVMGVAFEAMGDLESARKAYGWGSHAAKSDANMLKSWGRLSFMLAKPGTNNFMEEARIAFGKAVKLDPNDVDAAADYARCLTETKQHEQVRGAAALSWACWSRASSQRRFNPCIWGCCTTCATPRRRLCTQS